jgi:hypothetical protein
MSMRRVARAVGAAVGSSLVVVAGLFAGTGWLYLLRSVGWLGLGPRIGDALPLLQLAGYDNQPLVRVLIAWLLAGVLVGAVLKLSPVSRSLLAGILGLLLLLIASQAAYALTRNLRFTEVLARRTPGLGPFLEALLLALGCAALQAPSALRRARGGRPAPR